MGALGRDLHHFPGRDHFLTITEVEKQAALKNIADLLVLVVVRRDNSPLFHIDASEGHAINMHSAASDVRGQLFMLDLIPTMDFDVRRHRVTLPPGSARNLHIIQTGAFGG